MLKLISYNDENSSRENWQSVQGVGFNVIRRMQFGLVRFLLRGKAFYQH